MTENLKLGAAELISINPKNKTINLAIHLSCAPIQIYTQDTKNFIWQQVSNMMDYLYKEGFIDSDQKKHRTWYCNITTFCENKP
jgi:hypothetical protein